MNIKIFSICVLLFCAHGLSAQKYFSKTGKISFYSDAAHEKIEATNTSASTVLDAGTGAIEWAVLVRGFQFEKALMQDHFNENYMESSIYPKAKFKGKLDNLKAVQFSKDGMYTVNISGTMEMHGVTKAVSLPATFTVKSGVITARAKFDIILSDYKIDIPKVVEDKIAEKVTIDIQTEYKPISTTN